MQKDASGIRGCEYPAEYLKVKSAVELIAMRDELMSVSATERAFRRFASEEMIHWRDERGGGSNAHRLYAPSDVAVGAILSRITSDLGVADREVLSRISVELYRPVDGLHAITRALASARHGNAVTCRIAVTRDNDSERRFTVAFDLEELIGARVCVELDLNELLGALIEWLGADDLPPALANPPRTPR